MDRQTIKKMDVTAVEKILLEVLDKISARKYQRGEKAAMDDKNLLACFTDLLDQSNTLEEYVRTNFEKDKHIIGILIGYKRPFEDGILSDIKKLKNLKKLNIDTTQEEQHIERTFHTILDSFQKLNMYIYNKYKDDSEMRAALTNILMRIEDLSEHYYWVRIKERQNQDLEREEEDLEKH
mgnify:FL=1